MSFFFLDETLLTVILYTFPKCGDTFSLAVQLPQQKFQIGTSPWYERLVWVRSWDGARLTWSVCCYTLHFHHPFPPSLSFPVCRIQVQVIKDRHSQLEATSPLCLYLPFFYFINFISFLLSPRRLFTSCLFILYFLHRALSQVPPCVTPCLPACLSLSPPSPAVIWSGEFMALFATYCHGDESCC